MKIRKVLYANVSAAAFLAAWLAAGQSHALTLKEAVDLADYMKDKYGIEPAAGGAVMMGGGGGAAAAPAAAAGWA